jgi:hypothetical protein
MTEDEYAREVEMSFEKSVGSVIFKEFRSHHILRDEFEPNP